jgi:hypothetical protein
MSALPVLASSVVHVKVMSNAKCNWRYITKLINQEPIQFPCHICLLLENKNSQLFPSPSSPLLCSIMFHVVRGFFYQKRNKKNFSCIDMVSLGYWLIDYLACVTLPPCFGFSSSIPSSLFWNAFLGSLLHDQITVFMSSRLCTLASGVLDLISSLIQFGWLIQKTRRLKMV